MNKNVSFEDKIQKLEMILADSEDSNDIEKNLKMYEEGVKLYKDCRAYLDKVEQKINVLSESLSEKPFDS